MEPITSTLASVASSGTTSKLIAVNAIKDAIERNDVSPLLAAAGVALKGINFETNTEYAGLFNGFENASGNFESYFDKQGYNVNGMYKSFDDFLEKTGIKPAVEQIGPHPADDADTGYGRRQIRMRSMNNHILTAP